MHNRTLIALLAGAATFATASAGWAQSTPTTGTTTSSGSTTTEDRTMGTGTSTSSPTTSSSPSSSTTGTTSGTTTGTTGTSTNSSTTTGTGTGTGTQSTTGSSTTGTTGTSGTTGSSATYGTSGNNASGSAPTARTGSLDSTDATFLRKAMEGGLEEVQRAQAAMRSAQRAEVRNVASMMLEDHRRTNDKLTQLASSKGWNVPSSASSAAMAESDQSRMAAGPGFDDNYLEQEIRHHRETISLFRAQSSAGSDPDLRQFAKDTLPALEHHLEMLQGSYSAK